MIMVLMCILNPDCGQQAPVQDTMMVNIVYTGHAGAFAVWTPNISESGTFEVYTAFRTGTNRPTDARYTITSATGTTIVELSQYASSTSVVEVKTRRVSL